MSWVVEFKSQARDEPELWFREVQRAFNDEEEARVMLVQCIFDDSDYEFRTREIKENTNDQDQ